MRWLFALLASVTMASASDYIVVLTSDANPDTVARFHGIGAKRKWSKALKGFSGSLNASQIAKLEKDSRVQFIEDDVTVTNCVQTTPPGISRICCLSNALWQASAVTPINVDIAIIDTGIDLTHPDLNVISQVTFVTGTANANDDHGHGTHVAGIAAARNNSVGSVGVAPGAKLWAVKVLNSAGTGPLSQIISGVDYVTENASSIEVANLSLGGQGAAVSLRTAIQNCVAAGVVVVAAAGNSGFDVYGGDYTLGTSDDFFPGAFPECMTVSAFADTDGITGGLGAATAYGKDDALASFSNWSSTVVSDNPVISPGAAIDVSAPGVTIYSTYKNGGYATMSGTSMAAPHVAGAVALYIGDYGRATTASGVYAIRQAVIDAALPQVAWGINPTNPYIYDKKPEGSLDVVNWGPLQATYPNVRIAFPVPYVSTLNTTAIPFSGSAVDVVDGDLSAAMGWASSIDGALGNGAALSRALSVGTHSITASVTNSQGLVGRAGVYPITITAPTGSVPPTVTITAPATGATFASTDLILFTGTATDPVDGTITASLAWRSGIDGYIGSGGSFSNYLSPGAHVISAKVTNSLALTGSTNISITITGTVPPPPPTNYPPVVTISQPVNGITVQQGTTVVVSGTASDTEDGALSSSIVWSDNMAGALGSGASQSYTPAVGSHTVTASVADSAGSTATASRSFTVVATPAPAVALTVTVTANKASYIGKEKALITATVTANGTAVSGATVNISIVTATGRVVSKTGLTTGAAGTASYYQQINKSQFGTGTATVTANASKTSYVSGQGTTTFSVR